MLHPSYTELMEKINNEDNEGEAPVINSRYSIVIATSKRARDIISGKKPLVDAKPGMKPLSIAVEELYDSKIRIEPNEEEEDALITIREHSDDEFEELVEQDPAFANAD